MKERLSKLWQARAPRERTVIAASALILGLAAYIGLVLSAERGRAPLRVAVAELRTQSARLDQQALEYGQLQSARPATASASDLRALLQAKIVESGLASALVRIDLADADHVTVVFGAIAFADWLAFSAGLQAQHLRVESCRLEALAKPGLVSVTAILVRPSAQ